MTFVQCPLNSFVWQRHSNHYQVLSAGKHTQIFYTAAIETAGTWDDMAIELVQEIGRRTTVITQDTRETVSLFQPCP